MLPDFRGAMDYSNEPAYRFESISSSVAAKDNGVSIPPSLVRRPCAAFLPTPKVGLNSAISRSDSMTDTATVTRRLDTRLLGISPDSVRERRSAG